MSSGQDRQSAPAPILPAYAADQQAGASRRGSVWPLAALGLYCFVTGAAFAFIAPFQIVAFFVPLAVLGAVSIWALPQLRAAPTKTIEFLFWGYFAALVLWPNYLAFAPPGMPWITLLRLFGLPLAALLLICISVSREFRSELFSTLEAVPLLWRLLLVFVAIQIATMSLSHKVFFSINRFIVAQVGWTVVFFVSAFLFRARGRTEAWAVCLWGASVVVGLIAIWENHLGHVPWLDHIPSFLKIEDEDVIRILGGQTRGATGEYRAQSVFTSSLGLAEFTALTMPFVIYFASNAYRVRVRMAAAVTIAFLLYVVNLTDSRLGAVGCLLSFILYAAYTSATRWRHDKSSLFGPAITLSYPIIIAFIFALTLTSHRLKAKIWGNGPQDASNQSRADQIHMGIPIILRHPLGNGIGMSADTLGYVGGGGVLTVDNYYLTIALDYGILGFVVFYGMIVVAICYSVKYAINIVDGDRDFRFLIPLAIALVNFFVIKSVFSQEDNHPLVFMMLGMLTALVYRVRQERGVDARRSRTSALWSERRQPARSPASQ